MSALLEIQHQVQDTSAAIQQLEVALTADPGSLAIQMNLASVRSRLTWLEEEFRELADRNSLDVCKYRIFPADHAAISLRGFAGALGGFQDAFSALFDALKNGRRLRTRMSPDVVEATSFGFGYAYAGSVGVVLTLQHERLLLGGSLLDDTVTTFFQLAKAPSRADIQAIGQRLGPAPLRAIYRWADEHVHDSTGVEISWSRGPDATETVVLQQPELVRLRDEIAATSEEDHEELVLTGTLTGASVQTKRFDFQPDNAESISGTFTDAISEQHAVTLPTRYQVRLAKTTKIQYSSESEKIAWRLLSVTPAP